MVWATTACSTIKNHSAIPIKQPERPIAAELLLQHKRPEPPKNGSPKELLSHAVRYGAYCQKLENQISGWQAWYQQGIKDEALPRTD
ncbi:hypothetical protein QEO94_01885 [Kingella negevensis]|nr:MULTISPECIES: hypothetical protein [Kingella]MDK4624187.1 hypothetical protein [Kingella kingae]MDK4659766.1 hypothetical protein [Kingella kingae]MDK4667758.1 hypothetical protein [Kingella kingae]MDK4686120.1 hypothetical protein [Kingella kingae]WII93613.1 hypothetical protein QEO94_01885 [Kingella negevensis]